MTDMLVDDGMTTAMCRSHCEGTGAEYYATQVRVVCVCVRAAVGVRWKGNALVWRALRFYSKRGTGHAKSFCMPSPPLWSFFVADPLLRHCSCGSSTASLGYTFFPVACCTPTAVASVTRSSHVFCRDFLQVLSSMDSFVSETASSPQPSKKRAAGKQHPPPPPSSSADVLPTVL